MKIICTLLFATLVTSAAGAVTEPIDTAAQKADLRADNWDFSALNGSRGKNNTRFKVDFVSHAAFGWCTGTSAPEALDFRMGKSIEFSGDLVNLRYHLKNPRHSFSLGFGAGVRRYDLGRSTRLVTDGDGRVAPTTFPDDVRPKHSRLTVYSLRLPLHYSYRMTGDWYLNASAALSFNLRGRSAAKSAYRTENREVKETFRHLPLSRISADFTAGISYDFIGLYVRYNPCRMFEKGKGPEFTHLSVGLTLFY